MSGNRSAASTGGMTAFSAETIAATSSAPQKLLTSTPGRTQAATISATPVANHAAMSGKSLMLGRSGFQDVDFPYVRSASLGIVLSSSWGGGGIILHFVIVADKEPAVP